LPVGRAIVGRERDIEGGTAVNAVDLSIARAFSYRLPMMLLLKCSDAKDVKYSH